MSERPERLTDEQVAAIEAGTAHGGWCRSLAREVQAWRALINGGPCPTCGGRGWWLSADGETDCGTCERMGRLPGVIERLERLGNPDITLREHESSLAAVIAELRRALGGD